MSLSKYSSAKREDYIRGASLMCAAMIREAVREAATGDIISKAWLRGRPSKLSISCCWDIIQAALFITDSEPFQVNRFNLILKQSPELAVKMITYWNFGYGECDSCIGI
ncbi:MAG: hypothetical protein HQK62_14370 [Desulfamplus sp.]|nr:hypothetical protein [Desulfamplus sp.]